MGKAYTIPNYWESVVRALRYVGLALTQHTYNTAKKLSAIFSNQRRLYSLDMMAEISSSSLVRIGPVFKVLCKPYKSLCPTKVKIKRYFCTIAHYMLKEE